MEHNDARNDNLKERVLSDIASRDIRVYPRIYFILRIVLIAAIALLVLIISIFIFNYVFFSLRVSGRGMLLDFGPRGFSSFLEYFPWLLLVVDLALIVILEWLLRQFRFGYRSPVLYLLLGIFAITLSAGYLMNRATNIDDVLLHQADRRLLFGPLGEVYESVRGSHLMDQGICECKILGINGNILVAQDINATSNVPLTVTVPVSYAMPSSVQVGSVVFIAGTLSSSNTMQAFGISPLATSDIDMRLY